MAEETLTTTGNNFEVHTADATVHTDETPTTQAVNYEELLEGIDLDAVKAAGGMRKYIQSQADSRATKALNTAKANWEREQEEARDEATRLAKMTEQERAKYNFEKEKTEFERERRKFLHEQLVLQTAKELNAAGLPDLSEYVTGKDAETTKANLETVTKLLSAWKQEQVNGLMRGAPPKEMNAGKVITKAELKNMTPAEINQAWKEGLIDTGALSK